MAFCDLRPVKIYNEGAGVTYIIGEVFAVYANAPQPLVYSWDLVQKVTEDKRAITIHTENCDFIIHKKDFSDQSDYFRAIAIIECAQKSGGFEYVHQRRILPLKSEYIETDPGKESYYGSCEIDENDAAATFIMLMNFRLMKVLWLLAVMLMLVILLAFRCAGVFLCLLRTRLCLKERLFCMLAYTPKATVQAAIGGVPLAMGLACGNVILSGAVLAILVTATAGAFLIDLTAPRLLKKEE